MGFKRLWRIIELWLIIIFLLVLAIRLYIAFQTPYFNYEAYYSLRQAENIHNTGLPLFNDPLSYGGKTGLFAPLQYYILAVFSFLLPIDIVAKILPNIFASLIIIVVYFLSLRITKSPKISLLTSFMAGFIPILFFDINRVPVDYLAILLVFSIIYCMFKINERRYVDYILILIFLLVLTTPLSFILIIGLLFYMLLLKLENLNIETKESEIILFFTFLVFWVNLLIYKNAFLKHGLAVIWQNTPIALLSNTFESITLFESFYTISIIPLILGIYAGYIAFYKEKNKEILLLIGFGISSFLLLWFKLLSLVTGLVFLSLTLVILSAFSIKKISEFIEKTKFHRHETLFLVILIVLFIITAIIPSVMVGIERTKQTPTTSDLVVLEWASERLPADATIAATMEEGNMVSYYSRRKNIMDDNFLLTPNIDQRLSDVDSIFTTNFETQAVSVLNKYDSKYVFLSSYAIQKYHIKTLSYVGDQECFTDIYHLNVTVLYNTKCKITSEQ